MVDIKRPVLFMVGEGNSYEVKGAAVYPQMNNRFRVSVIPFASHLVHIEQPEIYTTILELFLTNVRETSK